MTKYCVKERLCYGWLSILRAFEMWSWCYNKWMKKKFCQLRKSAITLGNLANNL